MELSQPLELSLGVDCFLELRFEVTLADSDHKISGKVTMFHLQGKEACFNFWLGLAWPDFVKWYHNLLDNILLWTIPDQVYIFSNNQKVQFNLVIQDSLMCPKGPIFHC